MSARNVGSLFFPQRKVLQLGRETFSPGVHRKAVHAATETKSFQSAEKMLDVIGEITISGRHIGRLAQEAGQRLITQQRQRAVQHQARQLPVEVKNRPDLAVVEMDGGRIRTRQPGQGSGTHLPAWKETKNALFMRMSSDVGEQDSCPDLPRFLQNRNKIRKLVLEMSGTADGIEKFPEEDFIAESSPRYVGPLRLMRTCLSSLDDVHTFGDLMAAEAHRKGFYQSPRQAFVADGMQCNWTTWKKHFPTFTPIVDFLHVVSYLYHAAVAVGGDEDFGWGMCLEWTEALWQGRAADVIAALKAWQQDQSPSEVEPGDDVLCDDDPCRVVQKTVTYLTNNLSRMNYPEYRQAGLPLTSSLMESLVKEMNWRVKGTEKFWNNPTGATPILALKAASLSDDNRLESVLT